MGDYYDFIIIAGLARVWVTEADGSAREWRLTRTRTSALAEMLEAHEASVQRFLREAVK